MSPQATVRELTDADLHPLCARVAPLPLLARYGHTADRLVDTLRAGLASGDRILVYDAGHGAEGLAWHAVNGTLGVGGYLRLIAVAPWAHNTGAGTTLLNAFEASVRTHARHAFLLVSDFNQDARRFYLRHGYQHIGALPELVLPGVAELIFWKRLAQ